MIEEGTAKYYEQGYSHDYFEITVCEGKESGTDSSSLPKACVEERQRENLIGQAGQSAKYTPKHSLPSGDRGCIKQPTVAYRMWVSTL